MKRMLHRYEYVYALGGLVAGITAPIMYVVLKEKGFDVLQVGLLILLSAVTTILLEIPCGAVADKYGKKKAFLAGELLAAVSASGVFYSDSYLILSVSMVASGFGASLMSGTLDALLVNSLNSRNCAPSEIQSSLARLGFFQMAGMLLGIVLSGALLFVLPRQFVLPAGITNLETQYLFAVVALIAHMALTNLLISEPVSAHFNKSDRRNIFRRITDTFDEVAKNTVLVALMTSSAVSVIAFISVEKLWQLRLSDFSTGQAHDWFFSATFAGCIVAGAVGQKLSAGWCRLFAHNYNSAVIAIRLGLAGLFFLLYLSDGLLMFLPVLWSINLLSALSSSPVMTMFHFNVADAERATMLSCRSAFIQLGAAVGVIVMSLVGHAFSVRNAFALSSVIILASIGIMLQKKLRSLGLDLAQAS